MIRIRHPFVMCCLLLAAVFSDSSGIALCCILSAFLHESGHMLAYYLLLHRAPVVHIGITGMALPWHTMQTGIGKEVCILLAGPLANLAGFIFARCLLAHSMQMKIAVFAAANLFIGLFNMLPLRFMDGGRLLEHMLLHTCLAPAAERLLLAVQAASLLALTVLLFIVPGTSLSKASFFCCIIYCFAKSFCDRN